LDACTREVPCIEAADVGTLTVFRFDERAAAHFYGANASGVAVEGNVVVVLGPDATDADRDRLEGELDQALPP
jgi:hypothetical protein